MANDEKYYIYENVRVKQLIDDLIKSYTEFPFFFDRYTGFRTVYTSKDGKILNVSVTIRNVSGRIDKVESYTKKSFFIQSSNKIGYFQLSFSWIQDHKYKGGFPIIFLTDNLSHFIRLYVNIFRNESYITKWALQTILPFLRKEPIDFLLRFYQETETRHIQLLPRESRMAHLERVAYEKTNITEYSTNNLNSELAVLKIIETFSADFDTNYQKSKKDSEARSNNNASFFIANISAVSEGKKQSVFRILYEKMNDFGGSENFRLFIDTILKIWNDSIFILPIEKLDNTFIHSNFFPYVAEKQFFIFLKSNFKLHFLEDSEFIDVEHAGEKEKANRVAPIFETISSVVKEFVREVDIPKSFGTYHPFTPVLLSATNVDTPWTIPQKVVPVFYIKALYDKAEALNFEKAAFLTIDTVATFSGIGALTKLRFFRYLSRVEQVLVVAEGIQLTAGSLGILLTFSEKFEKEHPQLRWLLILIELKAMGVSIISTKMISRTAKEAIDTAPEAIKAEKEWPEAKKALDDLADETKIAKLEKAEKMWKEFEYKHFFEVPPKKPCFLAGTLVKTTNGNIAIEQIKVGDEVYCFDEINQAISAQKVSEVFINYAEKYLKLTTKSGEILRVTGQHLFYQKTSKTWIKAHQLKVGMKLYLPQTDDVDIINQIEIIESRQTTYNFEVPVHHNYLVGKSGILAHNANKRPSYASTTTRKYAFYELATLNGRELETQYIGKTTREDLYIRGSEHVQHAKKKGASSKHYWKYKLQPQIVNLNKGELAFVEMTEFESAILEKYYLEEHQTRLGKQLRNIQNPLSEKSFKKYKAFHTQRNPCIFFV